MKHYPSIRIAVAAATVSGLFAFSALAQEIPDDGVYKDRIDWGILMDLSGPTSSSQGPWVNGFQDYMRKINEAGGINGRKINVLAEDNRFNAATDKIAYEKLVGQVRHAEYVVVCRVVRVDDELYRRACGRGSRRRPAHRRAGGADDRRRVRGDAGHEA